MAKASKVVYIACKTCSLCKMINPTVSKIAEKAGVPVDYVDAENIPSDVMEVLSVLNVTDMPIILVYTDGGVKAFCRGMNSKIDLREFEKVVNG